MISIKNPSTVARHWVFDIVFCLLFFGIFYAIWLGTHALFTPDEGRYSEVAREMIVTHDYLTPRLNGVVFLDKPILYYWLQAIAMRVFGISEWSLRLWPAALGVLGCVMTYVAGRALFDRRTGLVSAMILATSPLYYGAAHYANLDLEVAVFVSVALLFFMLGIQATTLKSRTAFLLGAYVFSGFAALTKGLIGIAFPAMIVGLWILLLNRWVVIRQLRLVMGIVVFSLLVLPWYFLVQKSNPQFFHFFFVVQQFSRFLTTQTFNNQVGSWFYFPIVLAGFFPWTVFLGQALWQKVRVIWHDRQNHPVELYLLLWLILIFTFFSIPHSKTIGYILPIFPALALLVGRYLSNVWDRRDSRGLGMGIVLFIILSFILGVVFILAPTITALHVASGLHNYLHWMGGIFVVFSGLIFCLRQRHFVLLFSLLSVFAVMVALTMSASAIAMNQKTAKPLAIQIKPYLQPEDEIVTFYKYYQDLPMYLEKRTVIVADWAARDIPKSDNWLRELWYGKDFQDTHEWLISEADFWQRWHSKKRLFVFTDQAHVNQMKAKAMVYEIDQTNHIVLVSNQPFIFQKTHAFAQ